MGGGLGFASPKPIKFKNEHPCNLVGDVTSELCAMGWHKAANARLAKRDISNADSLEARASKTHPRADPGPPNK